jgi:hypothetical protein
MSFSLQSATASNTPSITVNTGFPVSPALAGPLCGKFAVHAGTAITPAAGNHISNGDVGVDADEFEPIDVMAFETGATYIAMEMGGLTFTAGAYKAGTINMAVGSIVTLTGDATTQFIFYAGTTLFTGANVTVVLDGGGPTGKCLVGCGNYRDHGS